MTTKEREHPRVRPGIWLGTMAERFRSSLFVVPLFFAVGALVLAEAMLWVDGELGRIPPEVPFASRWTVDSARAMLTTVASATITVAGIAFSVSLLTVQLAASEYSPRVIGGLFRDPFNRRVLGIVVGTFTYSLMVLRRVRGTIDGEGDAVIPSLSVLVAFTLGIVSILAVVAFIHHSAHNIEVSEILRRVSAVAERPPDDEARGLLRFDDLTVPDGPGICVRATRSGWLQQIDRRGVLHAFPDDAVVQLHVRVGGFVAVGTPVCTAWPHPAADEEANLAGSVLGAIQIGRTRTTQQDVSYAIRQIADVALRALSPGVNDPTTAQEALMHLTAALTQILKRPEAARGLTDRQRRVLIQLDEPDDAHYVNLAFDEIRRDGADRPTVCVYILDALRMIRDAVGDDLRPDAERALLHQARWLLQAGDAPSGSTDREAVFAAYRRWFAE